jgi:hypothetical protein
MVNVGALLAKHCDAVQTHTHTHTHRPFCARPSPAHHSASLVGGVQYVHARMPTYPKTHLYDVITQSRVHKGRLLHYFPRFEAEVKKAQEEAKKAAAASAADSKSAAAAPAPAPSSNAAQQINEDELGSWCGWHNDHGSLTALIPSMYIQSETGAVIPNPDPKAGLWIRSRKGELVQATFPADCMAFQMGETQQVHSGGLLQATPHCVLVCLSHHPWMWT